MAPDHDVFDNGLSGEKMGALEGSGQAAARDLIDAHSSDVFARKFHAPLLGAIKPGSDIQQRGLASTVRANDRQQFVVINGDGNVIQGGHAAKLQRRTAHGQRCRVAFLYSTHDAMPGILRHALLSRKSTQTTAVNSARLPRNNVLLPAPVVGHQVHLCELYGVNLTPVRKLSQHATPRNPNCPCVTSRRSLR